MTNLALTPTGPDTAAVFHPRVGSRHDFDQGLLITERQVIVWRSGERVAVATMIERECDPAQIYQLPRLIRFSNIVDAAFTAELDALFSVRRGGGPGRALWAAGWTPDPVEVEFPDGTTETLAIRPPFLAEAEQADAEFLAETYKGGSR
jgi:hypothetical protein